jgi:glutamyl-tRNA synthetase
MLGRDGKRLAKRHGVVTLAGRPDPRARVLSEIAASVGLCEPRERVTPAVLVERFDPARIPREPTTAKL